MLYVLFAASILILFNTYFHFTLKRFFTEYMIEKHNKMCYNLHKCGEVMTGKQMIKLFKRHGWKTDRVKGSHYIMIKGSLTITIPHHTRDLSKKAEKNYLKILSGEK